jgi:hypothetical protein
MEWFQHCIHVVFQLADSRRRVIALGALGLALGCSRTGLELDDWQEFDGEDGGGATAGVGGQLGTGGVASNCIPTEEICNGVDDDCDALVDEVPPIACEGGGEQYCVAGHMSECPKVCEVCMPGSERICFNSYCKFWATQTCAADGKGFGKCREDDPPPECASIAKKHKYSPELEQCCIDNGYCCRDEFDLDDDGVEGEMIGDCEAVACE